MFLLLSMSIITYGLGVFLWVLFYADYPLIKRLLYGAASHIIISVATAFTINLLFPTYFSSQLVFAITSILAIWLNYIKNRRPPKNSVGKQYLNFVCFWVIFIFVVSFSINTIIQSRQRIHFPLIGMNDDTATHLAMSVMTIKNESMLFKNNTLESLINTGINYQNARMYPPTVYTYLALLYDTFSSYKKPIDLYLLLNIYALFSFVIFLIFILSVLDLAFDLVTSINIWSIIPIVVFSIFFIGGEYFMVLYRMSYLTQLLGSAFLLLLYGVLGKTDSNYGKSWTKNITLSTRFVVLTIGIGFTYYLFLPIAVAGIMLLLASSSSYIKDLPVNTPKQVLFFVFIKRNLHIIATLLLASVPTILYALSHSVIEQITIPGINLLTLATLIQFCLMTLLFIFLRRYFQKRVYKFVLAGFLMSLALAITTTTPSMIKDGNLPYYFYKSFFTSASFSVVFGLASLSVIVSQINRSFHAMNGFLPRLLQIGLWVFLPLCFVFYLYSYKTAIYGYKAITYLAGGFFNYYTPHTTQKLVKLYNGNYLKKIGVYNPGYWGENILLFSLFENIPKIHVDGTKKEIYYFSRNPNYYLDAMQKDYEAGNSVFVFDGHGSFKPGQSEATNSKQ